jgi:hypothetical protein
VGVIAGRYQNKGWLRFEEKMKMARRWTLDSTLRPPFPFFFNVYVALTSCSMGAADSSTWMIEMVGGVSRIRGGCASAVVVVVVMVAIPRTTTIPDQSLHTTHPQTCGHTQKEGDKHTLVSFPYPKKQTNSPRGCKD